METSDRKQSGIVRRFRPAGVTPLELWDLCVGAGILWDFRFLPEFGAVLRSALEMLHAGGGTTRSDGSVPPCVRGFAGVYITGGGASGLAAAFDSAPWPVWFSDDGAFASERGGDAILAEQGMDGWIADLGQSALKISEGGRRWAYPRDYDRLPIRESDEVPVDEQREALRRFLADALKAVLSAGAKKPDAIVWALPSRLDDGGVPEGSSYIGMKGDASLVSDALALAGIGPRLVLVLNDAELAAVSARLDARVRGTTLALTVGFGVGAALLEG